MNADEIFSNLEEILNYNSLVFINRKNIEVVWAIRSDTDTVQGFVRVDNKVFPFKAWVEFEGELRVQIGNLIHFIIDSKTVEKAIQRESE
ncbi:hypothetical protein [Saccharolobus islandicus]|uniref:ORF89 n=1 Tax=Saccharolobus islandicus TaxID=43080 RepID=O05475_SACIS|nr:hypothetical protein [Sulfolobus islandicus]AAB51529.1 ORF89 [Sulfolobus islandicus]